MGISKTSDKRRGAQRLGRRAEFYCAWHLRAHGYRILTRGFRSPVGEVDLIARRGDVLAFVEVKARHGQVGAAKVVSARRRRRIIRAAGNFLGMHPGLA